jgi:hypothetical protein
MQRQQVLDSRPVVLSAAAEGFSSALMNPQAGKPIVVRVAASTVEKTTISVIGANQQQLNAAKAAGERAGVEQARRVV